MTEMLALADELHRTRRISYVPAGVVAQTWRGSGRQPATVRLLRAGAVRVDPLSEDVAYRLGLLLAKSGTSDVIDAHVTLLARRLQATVLTSDPDDLTASVTEPGSEQAAALLDKMAAGAVALLAPEHLVGEVANGLRKRVAQHVLTAEDACAALDAIAHLELTFVGGAGRWYRCLPAALERGISAYDALYVLLARDFDAMLVTADERLHTAVTGISIRLLGH